MLPILHVPKTVQNFMNSYRSVFCKEAGFESICRYITGLILSPNKTLQGIHDFQVYLEGRKSRRAMHQSVFESNWDSEFLMSKHRKNLSSKYRSGRGKSVIVFDWTFSHHDKGKDIFGVKKQYDYARGRYSNCQTVLTTTVANENRFDPVEMEVHVPFFLSQEKAYLESTMKASYSTQEEALQRLTELFYYQKHKQEYKKITEQFTELVLLLEKENQFPDSDYVFDHGVLNLEVTSLIESYGKKWVSELEKSRNVFFQNQWMRIDQVAQVLKEQVHEKFHKRKIRLRNGKTQEFYFFSKVFRLKRGWGKKKIVIVHEKEDFSDEPRFLICNSNDYRAEKIIQLWSYRWTCEIFHDFGKEVTGLEKAQVRNEESVKRHLRLCALSQSLLQDTETLPSAREKFNFADGASTIGQKVMSIAREALQSIIQFTQNMTKQNWSQEKIMDTLMPI